MYLLYIGLESFRSVYYIGETYGVVLLLVYNIVSGTIVYT